MALQKLARRGRHHRAPTKAYYPTLLQGFSDMFGLELAKRRFAFLTKDLAAGFSLGHFDQVIRIHQIAIQRMRKPAANRGLSRPGRANQYDARMRLSRYIGWRCHHLLLVKGESLRNVFFICSNGTAGLAQAIPAKFI